MVEYFVNGGPFMWPILISLIFGLGFSFERLYSLLMSSVNSKQFFMEVLETLEKEGAEPALEPVSYTHLTLPTNREV